MAETIPTPAQVQSFLRHLITLVEGEAQAELVESASYFKPKASTSAGKVDKIDWKGLELKGGVLNGLGVGKRSIG